MAPLWRTQLRGARLVDGTIVPGAKAPMRKANDSTGTMGVAPPPPSSTAPRSSASSGAAAASGGDSPGRKQASIPELIEYIKSLDVDPVDDVGMLWIAEEAFHAPLPPGWTEFTDEEGCVNFHHAISGESTLRHPMDNLYREVVEYQRRVHNCGGFWEVEDEITELEESIRRDLADWMELFDENGEKFFYNRRTDESRFDDPRMAVYHNLYARIKMISKMKEQLPLLASAVRPLGPTEAEIRMRQRIEEEEERFLCMVIKVQSFARRIIAKRRVRLKIAQAAEKGPRRLRGKLRLRMEQPSGGGEKELTLSLTTPHRRTRAATKIQARCRGIFARKKYKPLVIHRQYLSAIVTKVQAVSRVWLAKRRVRRIAVDRRVQAATTVQKVYRGYRDRLFCRSLRVEKQKFDLMCKCVVTVQGGFRMRHAIKEAHKRKDMRNRLHATTIYCKMRMYQAQCQLAKLQLADSPIQCVFACSQDRHVSAITPWEFQLWSAPWAHNAGGDIDQEEPSRGFWNLFGNVGFKTFRDTAATRIQAHARGMILRCQKARTFNLVRSIVEGIEAEAWSELQSRDESSIQIQRIAHGRSVRNRNLLKKKIEAHLGKNFLKISAIQALMSQFVAQSQLVDCLVCHREHVAAASIQARWRGILAREHVEHLREESLWLFKGFFEYTATGRDAIHAEVRFLHNPSLNGYSHFAKYGTHSAPAETSCDVDPYADMLRNATRRRPTSRDADAPQPADMGKGGTGVGTALADAIDVADALQFSVTLNLDFDKLSAATELRDKVEGVVMSEVVGSIPNITNKDVSLKLRRGSVIVDCTIVRPQLATSDSVLCDMAKLKERIVSRVQAIEGIESVAEGDANDSADHVGEGEKSPRVRSEAAVAPATPTPKHPSLATSKAPVDSQTLAPRTHVDSSTPIVTAAADSAHASSSDAIALGKPNSTTDPRRRGRRRGRKPSPDPSDPSSRPSSRSSPRAETFEPRTADLGGQGAHRQKKSAAAIEKRKSEYTPPLTGESPSPIKQSVFGSTVSSVSGDLQGEVSPERPTVKDSASVIHGVAEPRAELEQQGVGGAKGSLPDGSQGDGPREEVKAPGSVEPPSELECMFNNLTFDDPPSELPAGKTPQQKKVSPVCERKSLLKSHAPPSQAHVVLKEAPGKYVDLSPIYKDSSPRPSDQAAPPFPPTTGSKSLKELSGRAVKAAALGQSQSAGAVGADAARKTYGGTLSGKTFVRNPAESVDDLSEADKLAVLCDIERLREDRVQELRRKQKEHKVRQNQEEAAKAAKLQSFASEGEAAEKVKQEKKVAKLKEWLRKKEEECRARKAKDQELMQQILAKAEEKKDKLARLEKQRLEERERRIHIARDKKERLESQLSQSSGTKEAGSRKASGTDDAPLTKAHHLAPIGKQLEAQPPTPTAVGVPPSQAETPRPPKRMVHRHIHHHVHYHDGEPDGNPNSADDEQGAVPLHMSPEERRNIELASEARVREQLEASALAGQQAWEETPTMRRSMSVGSGRDALQLSRTQEAFPRGAMRSPGCPPADLQDISRQKGLVRYGRNVARAHAAFADSGRPRNARTVVPPLY